MKLRIILLLFIFCLLSLTDTAQSIGEFSDAKDIGNPKKTGLSRYDAGTQTYYMKGAGYNVWFNRDEFQYLYKKCPVIFC